jgi:large subunit ribosomal protein L30
MAEKKEKAVKVQKEAGKAAEKPVVKVAEKESPAKAEVKVAAKTKEVAGKSVAKKSAQPATKTGISAKAMSSQREIKGPSITVKQVASGAGRLKNQIQTLKGLGLNKVNKVSTLEDTKAVRGMIRTVAHLLEVVKN